MRASPVTKANITCTRRAACNTGNRDMYTGSLTIYYPVGGEYQLETANQRHIRESIERMQAARAVANVVAASAQLIALGQTLTNAAQAMGSALAKASRKAAKRKTAHLAITVATRSSRAPRNDASKARDRRYQWLKLRLSKVGAYIAKQDGVYYIARQDGTYYVGDPKVMTACHTTALDAMETAWGVVSAIR